MIGDMRSAWSKAGHEVTLDTVVQAGGVVLDENEPAESPRAIAQTWAARRMLLHRAADAALMGLPTSAAPPEVADCGRQLCRAGEKLSTARRALPRKPSWPLDVC